MELTLHKTKYMNELQQLGELCLLSNLVTANCGYLIHCVVMKYIGNEYMNLSECFSPICVYGL